LVDLEMGVLAQDYSIFVIYFGKKKPLLVDEKRLLN
jgi:hypothetical protein